MRANVPGLVYFLVFCPQFSHCKYSRSCKFIAMCRLCWQGAFPLFLEHLSTIAENLEGMDWILLKKM